VHCAALVAPVTVVVEPSGHAPHVRPLDEKKPMGHAAQLVPPLYW